MNYKSGLLGSVPAGCLMAACFAIAGPALAQAATPTQVEGAAAPVNTTPGIAAATGQPNAEGNSGAAEIVVTGSRLANTGFTAPTPVSVVGADRLQERAATNIGDALNEIPAFRSTNTPAGGELNPNAGYIGGRILDLRGLGSVRTLTLLDGKRFVPSTTQATVDTNMIPSILLSRAEVVTGGASAQYGSDAVAGVVNLILDKRFEGIKGNAQYGQTKYGDNQDYTASLAYGTKIGDRLHFTIGGEYEKDKGTGDCQARPFCRTDTLNFGRNPGYTAIPANNITSPVIPSTVPFNGVTVPPSSAYTGRLSPSLRSFDGITFNNDGTPRHFQYGSPVNNLYMVGGEGGTQNVYFENLFLIAPTERYNLTANLQYEVSPSITANFMFNYGHLEGDYSTYPYRNAAITISASNPFIPRSADPTLDLPTLLAAAGATSFQLGKGFDEIGRTPLITKDDVYRGVFSLEGKLGGNWSWDLYYEHGENRFRDNLSNAVVPSRLLNAINAVRTPSGAIVCGINADAIATNNDPSCVPYNPFGRQASAAAKAYVVANGFQTNNTNENVVSGNVRGTLFNLPYGPVAIAIGGEYRNDKVSGDTDAISQALGFFNGNGSLISGRIAVAEGYGEAEIPILKGLNFANELSLNGAVRGTHYDRSSALARSSSLTVVTYKFGGVYEPFEAIRFRATKSRDIRAPNVAELFGPTTLTSGILTDPARGGVQTVSTVYSGSNANLQPEKANTFTAGVVFKPRGGFLGRLRGSVDYYHITINDAIATLGQQNIVTRCFQGDALSCANVVRDPTTNAVTTVFDVFQNVNQQIERGIDFEIDYRQPLGRWGRLDFRGLATYINEYITRDAVGPVDRAGQTGLRAGTPPGVPDWTLDGLLTWSYQAFQFNTHVRYINSGFYNAAFIGAEQPGYSIALGNSSNTNFVPSRTYLDLLGQYTLKLRANGAIVFYAGVDNITNSEPPLNPGSHGTGNFQIFPPQGRTYKGGIRFSF